MAHKVSDWGVAAFFKIRKVPLKDFVVLEEGKKIEFEFDIDEDEGKALEMTFYNSEYYPYDQAKIGLRKLTDSRRNTRGMKRYLGIY